MIATITSGIFRGVMGTLRRRFFIGGIEYAEIKTPFHIYVVRVEQIDICDDFTERAAVDEALREEQKKRGLR
jgi:hypothetical protein